MIKLHSMFLHWVLDYPKSCMFVDIGITAIMVLLLLIIMWAKIRKII